MLFVVVLVVAQILRQFKKKMTDVYGDKMGDAIMDHDMVTETDSSTVNTRGGTMSGISLATEDRYLNGLAKFIITGIKNVQVAEKEQTLHDIRKTDNDINTMNVKSTTSRSTEQGGATMERNNDKSTIQLEQSKEKTDERQMTQRAEQEDTA